MFLDCLGRSRQWFPEWAGEHGAQALGASEELRVIRDDVVMKLHDHPVEDTDVFNDPKTRYQAKTELVVGCRRLLMLPSVHLGGVG